MRRPLVHALLFVGAAALCALTMLEGIQPNDEGLMLAAAARIADGQVPYGDFWWFYPPGQPYLLAGLQEVFGPSLLTWRIVRVLADAAVVVLVHALARRGGAQPATALAGAVVAAFAMAVPSGPHPFPIALALALGALLTFAEHPLRAGVLAGACAAWRIEFAAYLGLGVLIAYALAPRDRAPSGPTLLLPATTKSAQMRFVGAAALTAGLLYAPVVLSAGLRDSFELLIDYPLTDFTDYQSLPFPFFFDGPLNTSSVGGFFEDSAEPLLAFYLPLAAALGFAGALIALGTRFDRTRHWPRVATAVFSVGMAHYMLVRTDLFHTAPLVVMLGVLVPWAIATRTAIPQKVTGWVGTCTRIGAAVAGVALVFAGIEGADRTWLALREDNRALELDVADGARTGRQRASALEDTVRFVRARVPEGEPVYVTTRRSDLITAGDPLLYVLAARPNPTRYDIAAPGVVNSAPVAREIVSDLRRTRPRVIVRNTSPVTAADEPNRAGESTGVLTLDRYLASAYAPAARFGPYLMLVPRRAGGTRTDPTPSGRRRAR